MNKNYILPLTMAVVALYVAYHYSTATSGGPAHSQIATESMPPAFPQTAPQAEISLPATDRNVSPAGKSGPTTLDSARPVPEAHQEELDAKAGAEDFPAAFDTAVARADEALAGAILQQRYSKVPQQSAAIYAFLKPYMLQHHFLWQRPILVESYISACADLPECDRSAALAKWRRENPESYGRRGDCLDSWTRLVPLARQPQTKPDPARLAEIDRGLESCLTRNLDDPQSIQDQLQFYLYYVQSSLGTPAASARAAELAQRFPTLPASSLQLPARKQ